MNYYKDELDKIITKDSPYGAQIKIMTENSATKWLRINEESAKALKSWIDENFPKSEWETTQEAKEVLASKGYHVDNLWSIPDVKGKYHCTDDEAMEVLRVAMNNEATYSQIWESIDSAAESLNLNEIEG